MTTALTTTSFVAYRPIFQFLGRIYRLETPSGQLLLEVRMKLFKLREAITAQMMRVEIMQAPPLDAELPAMEAHHVDPITGQDELALADSRLPMMAGGEGGGEDPEIDPRDPRTWGKVARNAPCPCGSGKKFKHCHGRFLA